MLKQGPFLIMRIASYLLVLSSLSTAITCPSGCSQQNQLHLKAIVEPQFGEVQIKGAKTDALIYVNSLKGIGRATIESSSSTWPERMTISINIQGLEHFEIASGPTKLHASLASYQSDPPLRVWLEGKEGNPLNASDGLWIDIQKDVDQERVIINVPTLFLRQGGPSIEFQWIDYYR